MLEINLNDNKIMYTFNFVGEHFEGSNLFEATILFSNATNGLFVFLFFKVQIEICFLDNLTTKGESQNI